MITLCSIFRNATSYLPQYFAQVNALRKEIPVRLVLAEGDNADATGILLRQGASDGDRVITVDHGGRVFGSIDAPERWANIAKVVRGVIDAVGEPGEVLAWVEGDLIWDPETMLSLLVADRPVTPMVMAGNSPRFYDIWGHRALGHGFLATPPYIPGEVKREGPYAKIDSCGSCFALPPEHFDSFYKWDGMWPFTAGGDLWLNTETRISHP